MEGVCRICLRDNKDLISLSTPLSDCYTIDQLIQLLSSTQIVEADGIPKTICQGCFNQLHAIWLFINLIKQSNVLLQTFRQTENNTEHTSGNKNNFKMHCIDKQDLVAMVKLEKYVTEESQTSGKINKKTKQETDYKIFEQEAEFSTKNENKSFGLTKISTNSRVWRCQMVGCSASYIHKNTLKLHYKNKHSIDSKSKDQLQTNNQQCLHRVNIFQLDSDNKPLKTLNNKNYECELCKKHFLSKNVIRNHIYNCHLLLNNSTKCPYCGKNIKYKCYLKRHIQHKHEKLFTLCPICNKQYNVLYIKKHYKLHQSKMEASKMKSELTCNECGKVLKTKCGFETHQKIHKSVREFICEICSAGFITKLHLQTHKKYHVNENTKWYNCHICESKFLRKATLERHILSHTGQKNFICEICSKGFCANNELQRHLKMHYKIANFVCEYCCKTYYDQTAFRIHMMSHKNIRPYACRFCQSRFVVRQRLTRHMLNIHRYKENKSENVKVKSIPLKELLKM